MAELKPGQIEVNGYVIDQAGTWSGERRPVKYHVFEPGGRPTATKNDRSLPSGDGKAFGKTYLDGRVVAIEMSVDCGNIIDATRAYNDLAAVWYDPMIRLVEDVAVPLRYRPFAGLPTRVMYGRPDAFDPANEWLLEAGRVDIVASFETADPLFWADPEGIEPVVIPITPPTTGGVTFPMTFPMVMQTTSEGFGEFWVDGTVATPLVARVNGPITNPMLDYLGRWDATIETTLLYDQHLDIDARPGVRTVMRSDGVNLSGKFRPGSQPLSDMLLHPGPAEMVLRGLDPTGTASLTLTPQAASATPYF